MCAPAIRARAGRDKIHQCFLTSNRCQARRFEKHQQLLQSVLSETGRAQSSSGVSWCCSADGTEKAGCMCGAVMGTSLGSHSLVFHCGVVLPLQTWLLGGLPCFVHRTGRLPG